MKIGDTVRVRLWNSNGVLAFALRLLMCAFVAPVGQSHASSALKLIDSRDFISYDGSFSVTAATAWTGKGVVVTGSEGLDAWASMFDDTGKPLWEYRSGFREHFDYPLPSPPVFRAATLLPDSKLALCGTIPRSRGLDLHSTYLAIVDDQGKPIKEDFITPSDEMGRKFSSARLLTCTRLGDELLVVGVVTPVAVPGSDPLFVHLLLWTVCFNSRGEKQSENLEPLSFTGIAGPVPDFTSAMSADNGVIISVSDSNTTELLSINRNGAIDAHATFPGLLRLVAMPSGITQKKLIGFLNNGGKQTSSYVYITLGKNFGVTDSQDSSKVGQFYSQRTFCMRDGSLISFGTAINGLTNRHFAGFVSLSQSLVPSTVTSLASDDDEDIGRPGAVAEDPSQASFTVFLPVSSSGRGIESNGKRAYAIEIIKLKYQGAQT